MSDDGTSVNGGSGDQYSENKAWILLEDRIDRLSRPRDNETWISFRFEQWQLDAVRKIHRTVDSSKPTIMCAALEYGYELEEEELLSDLDDIIAMRTRFTDFYKEHHPSHVNTDILGYQIDEISSDFRKLSEANFTEDQNVPTESQTASAISDMADEAFVSKSSIDRILLARGLEESELIREEEQVKSRQLVKMARESTETAREPLEREIARYTGSVLPYLEAELDDGGIDELEQIANRMETAWKSAVERHIEILKAET